MGAGDAHAEVRARTLLHPDDADSAAQRPAPGLIPGQSATALAGEAGVAVRIARARDRGGGCGAGAEAVVADGALGLAQQVRAGAADQAGAQAARDAIARGLGPHLPRRRADIA